VTAPERTSIEQALGDWLPTQRWFAHKGHEVRGVRVLSRDVLAQPATPSGARTEHLTIAVDLAADYAPIYQVPLGFRREPLAELAAWALPASADAPFGYDGLRDPECIRVLADAFATGTSAGSLRFRTAPGTSVSAGMSGRVLGAEQSNSSVVLGEQLLLKVFRQLAPGVNPDLELHRALAGCRSVATVRAWLEGDVQGQVTTLAIAQDYAANSADGWSMALTSVRDLFAEADLHAAEVGTDFAGEAHRLGGAVAEVHAALAGALGTAERAPEASPVPAMLSRLESAITVVPELGAHSGAAQELFRAADSAATGDLVQRVHGDLHLGQVLRTPTQWLLIDFEGEPAKSLAERRRPDSVLRDVAGMLRSFDYAAHHQLHDTGLSGHNQLGFRAKEWALRNSSAFCDGYTEAAGADPRAQNALLRAYELDKAIYEAVYEARNRPSWLEIPLRAVARLCSATTRRAEDHP